MYRVVFLLLLTFLISCGSGTKNTVPEEGGSTPVDTTPDMADLPVFQSANGVLDLLIEAKQATTQLVGLQPQTYVYQVCPRSAATNDTCPNDSRTAAPYGGVRLQLQAGDHLKIRLVNRLPSAPPDAEHMLQDTGMLAANPTNLHTHGLIVEPRRAGNGDPTYGDYVYVLGYPAGKLPTSMHPGLDYTDQPLDYDVYIPPNHPSGLFWFHPHVHGLSLNQITAGLAGVITIGSINDYVKDSSGAAITPANVKTRQLLLKDTQIESNSVMLTQQDSSFCPPDPVAGEPPREGFCSGQYVNGIDYRGGKWVHSINGQVYPAIHVVGGEVWRITAASASRSYDLKVVDDASGKPLVFQVLSLDGVSLDIPDGTPMSQVQAGLRNRVTEVACPASALGTQPVCGTMLHVLPSARAEIYVSAANAASSSATLLTDSYQTGPAGDDWPSVKLAHVFFSGAKPGGAVLSVHGQSRRMLAPDGVLGSAPLVKLPGVKDAVSINDAIQLQKRALTGPASKQLRDQVASLEDASCQPLAAGHRRRIFFGLPPSAPPTDPEDEESEAFGLGYEELDETGTPVPGTFRDIAAFDHTVIDVCLPLGPGNQPVTEQWELVNVSGEDHNFHIHQTKFWLIDGSGDAKIMMDSVPVPHGTAACDGTVATWRNGQCQVKPLEVDIPFSQVGDFMYHCHILEHEDGGMMAHIRVVANP